MTHEVQAFKAEMDTRFGNDEALGVYFEFDDGSQTITLSEFHAINAVLGMDMPGTISFLPHGGSGLCCTDYAVHIYMALQGRVQIFGFANEDNPKSRVAREEIHVSGHDFAVVDGRFLVDPWPRLVPMVFEEMVFDLQDPADAKFVLDVYGPRECWTHMLDTQAYAEELLGEVIH